MGRFGATVAVLALILSAGEGGAKARDDAPAARPELFRKLVDCRSVADSAARLACYDTTVSALDAAEQKRELVVVDKGQVRTARRSLFGFALPNLSIFGGGDAEDKKEAEEFSSIETKIRSAYRNAAGRWVITIDEGAQWLQIDSRDLAREPRAGLPIKISKAALGSYFAKVDGQIAIRMKRDR